MFQPIDIGRFPVTPEDKIEGTFSFFSFFA
jgi:hypothetical protein